MEVPNGPATLTVLSCPFPTVKGTEAVFPGSLGDAMDVICPVTIRMRDVKGQCITIASVTSIPTMLNLAISTSDPLNEEAPTLEEGAIAEPPGPDRLGLEISEPTDTPCIALLPKSSRLQEDIVSPLATLSKLLQQTLSRTSPVHQTWMNSIFGLNP